MSTALFCRKCDRVVHLRLCAFLCRVPVGWYHLHENGSICGTADVVEVLA